ncbi:efflux RND transporter periplasmic adaptor subunit [Achromobacter kerstersii]|uniref:efflux RND transporter periplasmic adaptor subunit n=1 Tax=Achromobacter kerstersii TaxID=1353890 RepID=UPI003CFBF7B7
MQNDLLLLLQLAEVEGLARQADSVQQLSFHIANDAHPLLAYRQALVFEETGDDWRLLNISGLVSVEEQSPYIVWLAQVRKWLRRRVADGQPQWVETSALDDASPLVRDGWREWWPAGVWALPLKTRGGAVLGWVLYLLEQAPTPGQSTVMARLCQTWSYSWELLARRRKPLRAKGKRRLRHVLLFALVALCFLPIRQSALAPAEVTSLDLQVISAPLDGVVKTIHVSPNQSVKAGQPLFALDDTTLSHRQEVATQAVAVADAELMAARQTAFRNDESRAKLTTLQSRAEERRAELASIRSQLDRLEVTAQRDGIAVFADANDWLGKPVVTGERIMQLADPAKPAMLIQLPVADALSLDVGAPVNLFLTVRPLHPLAGKIIETSYQSALTPEGVPSYRLRASIDPADAQDARIGLKGTARIQGERSFLGYEIIRRPLATLRALTGL